MSSGEWDLRALKALEEEEQKEFLALSQKNLFDGPLPGGAGDGITNKTSTLTYAQLHPHLLKLPTIDECQLIAAKRHAFSPNGGGSSSGLKFTRALSLSAHSLSPRASSSFGKKLKARLVGAKSSGSLSPSRHSHSYSVSPVYTPPPMRRCATLHHTQPVRKAFKNLQQLERKRGQMPPQLQRIAGTNKTYWKYGANSTAASIIGQRAQRQQRQGLELESNTSDEHNSESDILDSATETGSCSVPLPAADSNELLRLMLNAASSAVTATGGPMPIRRYQHQQQQQQLPVSDVDEDEVETVAYEAYHQQPLNLQSKSFERKLLGLTGQENNSHCNSPKLSPSRLIQSTTNRRMYKSNSLDAAVPHQQQQQQQQPQQQQETNEPRYLHQGKIVCYGGHQITQTAAGLLTSTVIDDELEQHIKHCSCSCNHMGYGNSMDYQPIPFDLTLACPMDMPLKGTQEIA
ncbi:uncharacterized protein Dwil_GK13626 [Drosophila willistoni]|uniref:Uncharacterized protein n=1 Tax=Drosophila willistoni TaxID=7260 RepID=B4N3Y5_DROWI|nr:uncharacterized protein Dwil_GK13626 [Drosophila willistoni]